MDETVEDGVGEGWLTDEVVPGFDRELTGHQRRAAAVTILDDLHEIAPLAGVEAVGTEVIEYEQVDLREGTEEARKTAVSMRELQLSEEPRHARVIRAVSLSTGPLGGAGEPGFAEAAFPVMSRLRLSVIQRQSRAAGRALCGADVVCGSSTSRWSLTVAQPRSALADLCALCFAVSDLAVEQQRKPFGVSKIFGRSCCSSSTKGVGHAVELESSELFDSGMSKHRIEISLVVVVGPRCCRGRWPAVSGFLGRLRSRRVLRMDLTDVEERAPMASAAPCCFEPLAAVSPGELDDAATGSEALLGVWPLTQDNLYEGGGMRADCARLLLLRSSVQSAVAPMARGHVLG